MGFRGLGGFGGLGRCEHKIRVADGICRIRVRTVEQKLVLRNVQHLSHPVKLHEMLP